LALGGTAARIANHSRRPANQHDWTMAGALESSEHQRGQKASGVQTIRRWIESDVDFLLAGVEQFFQGGAIRYVVDRPALV
jgi:hypothetical protein